MAAEAADKRCTFHFLGKVQKMKNIFKTNASGGPSNDGGSSNDGGPSLDG